MISILPVNSLTLVALQPSQPPISIVTYGRFLEYLDNGWVKKVDFYNSSKFVVVEVAIPDSGSQIKKIGVNIPSKDIKLIRKLKDSSINFDVHAEEEETSAAPFNDFGPLDWLFAILALTGIVVFWTGGFLGLRSFFEGFSDIFTKFNNTKDSKKKKKESYENDRPSNPFNPFSFRNFTKSRARFDIVPDTGVTFDDVAGIEEVKEEFQELVAFLKSPALYTKVGARIPKGVLLTGPPGTGKTLLAKAIAGEAKVPFFRASASEFVELFVGIGASRIRDLFAQAKQLNPCLIFIDEIDAIGRTRGAGIGGGNDEREQTLNQLLTEMDGFQQNNGVMVIAATNRSDILDPALLRAGRFDRQLLLALPEVSARFAILNVHARGKKLDKDVDLQTIAKRTSGFSGADLANLLNEAAILAARYGEKTITIKRVHEALDKIIGGIPSPPLPESRYKRILAYHELGHGLTASLLETHDPVQTVSLIPRGRRRSLTTFIQLEEGMVSRKQVLSRLTCVLAGRAAEEVVFGKTETTTIGIDDIKQATLLARQCVTEFGMSPLGPVSLEDTQQPRDVMLRALAETPSSSLGDLVDRAARMYIEYSYTEATKLIRQHRPLLDKLVDKILQKETLEGYEIRRVLTEGKNIDVSVPLSNFNRDSNYSDSLGGKNIVWTLTEENYKKELEEVSSQEEEEKTFESIIDKMEENYKNEREEIESQDEEEKRFESLFEKLMQDSDLSKIELL